MASMTDEDLLFTEEEAETAPPAALGPPWKLLVVDDEEEVHAVTRLALGDLVFLDRPLEVLKALSGRQAMEVLRDHPDVAVILLDVVMEADDAGLRLVHRIRHDLGNRTARIILRTGQPGAAPEKEVIVGYDINDYKAKTELTESRLFTTVVAALRGYRDLMAIQEANERLEERVADRTRELRKFQAAVEHSSVSILITDRRGVIEYVNPAFTWVSGFTEAEVVGKTPALFKSGEMPEEVYAGLWSTISDGGSWRGELINRRKDGSTCWENMSISPIYDEDGRAITHFVSVREDVTRQKEMEDQLRRLATMDALTDVMNRRHFFEMAEQELHRSRRHGRSMAALMIDVDLFKRINDTHGHGVGDRVLVAVAQGCRASLRDCDWLGRLGGEEFAVILSETGESAALVVAERMRKAIGSQAVPLEGGGTVSVTASMGVAVLEAGDAGVDDLLARADSALYRAKGDGRDRVCLAGC